MQNPLLKRQICPKFINVMMENNRLHKSGANSTLYNISMKGLPLLSQIFIWSSPVFFYVIKSPSVTSIYLSVSTNKPGIKYKISGVMWQVASESKIQLVSCDLSQKYLLVIYTLEDTFAIDVYNLCDLISSVLFLKILSIFVDLYARVLEFSCSSELYYPKFLVSEILW